jgi:hypothetical protein
MDQTEAMLIGLHHRIKTMEADAYEDCRRYEDETRDRCRRRMERFHAETVDMRCQIDHIVKLRTDVELLKPMPVAIFPDTQLR